MGRLDGKIVLLGGGLGSVKGDKFIPGLSIWIAKKLVDDGAQVILTDVAADVVQKAAAEVGGKCKGIACDLLKVRDYEEKKSEDGEKTEIVWKDNPALTLVDTIVKEFGKLDVLITNFDYFEKGRVISADEQLYMKLRDENIKPVFHLVAAVRDQWATQKKTMNLNGKLIMITSITGKAGMGLAALYSAFKSGIVGLNKTLARELGRFAQVNSVAIGPLSDKKLQGPPDKLKSQYMVTKTDYSNIDLTPELVAGPVAFLASDDSNGISGQTINVDGGLWIKVEI
jgi:3-oxoacyl-[acyl-carrier protein] reductase